MLFSTHRMEHVEELCRNITILHKSNTVLQGSLKEIKRQLPERANHVLVLPVTSAGLASIPGVTAVKETAERARVQIHSLVAGPQPILQKAMELSKVHRFEIMEPTLNEIFIRTVGESMSNKLFTVVGFTLKNKIRRKVLHHLHRSLWRLF